MPTVSEEALTTLSEVRAFLINHDAADAMAEEVFTDGGEYDEEGISGIESASDDVRDYLRRELYASVWKPLLASGDWKKVKRTPDSSYPYQLQLHRIPDWPVLAVTEDVKIHEDRRRIFAQDRGFGTLEIWAGYRRDGQTAADLGVDTELNDSDIPTYPENFVQVVKRISVYYATQQVKGLIGVRSEKQMMGEFSTQAQVTETDNRFVQHQLKTLQSHRLI